MVELNALEKMEEFFSAISWCGVLTLKYEKWSDKCSGLLAICYSLGLSKHGKSSWETLQATLLSHLNCKSKLHF